MPRFRISIRAFCAFPVRARNYRCSRRPRGCVAARRAPHQRQRRSGQRQFRFRTPDTEGCIKGLTAFFFWASKTLFFCRNKRKAGLEHAPPSPRSGTDWIPPAGGADWMTLRRDQGSISRRFAPPSFDKRGLFFLLPLRGDWIFSPSGATRQLPHQRKPRESGAASGD